MGRLAVAVVMFISLSLVGCGTNRTPRNDPPKTAFHSVRSFDDMTACVVARMNAAFRTGHYAQTIVPGKIVEVTSQQQLMVGGQPYFARITAEPGGSMVEFYTLGPAFGPEGVEGCQN